MPTIPKDIALRNVVRLLIRDLDAIGFGTEEAVSGTDTVEVILEHYLNLKELSE